MDPSELDGIKEDVDYYIEVETNQGSLDIFHCIYLSPSTLLCFAVSLLQPTVPAVLLHTVYDG